MGKRKTLPNVTLTLRDGSKMHFKSFVLVGIREVNATHFTSASVWHIVDPSPNKVTVLQYFTTKAAYDLSKGVMKAVFEEESNVRRTKQPKLRTERTLTEVEQDLTESIFGKPQATGNLSAEIFGDTERILAPTGTSQVILDTSMSLVDGKPIKKEEKRDFTDRVS